MSRPSAMPSHSVAKWQHWHLLLSEREKDPQRRAMPNLMARRTGPEGSGRAQNGAFLWRKI